MKNNGKKIEEDIEYLDENFPKGKSKFRGEAMVLLALARRQGKSEGIKESIKIIEKWKSCHWFESGENNLIAFDDEQMKELTQKLNELKGDEENGSNPQKILQSREKH